LTDFRLRERAELGRGLLAAVKHVAGQAQGLSFAAAHIDGRDWAFLFVAARKCDRNSILTIAERLMGGVLAQYNKSNGMVIIDRDGDHYDLALSKPDYQPTSEDAEIGEKYFGSQRIGTIDISRL
jgi:hypothetical protein